MGRTKTLGILAAGFAALTAFGAASCASTPSPRAQGAAQALLLQEAIDRAAAEIAGKLPAGTSVAVVSFESEAGNVSDYIMEELDFALLERGLVVADRARLASVRKELNFQASGEVDDKTAQSIGQFLGVPFTVTGQFQPAGDAYRFRVTVIQAESAVRSAAVALNVRNDEALRKLLATLKKSSINTHEAAY
ncbi:MAG: penicillin-binding protein activator LpoB [Treponematales bacterium]